MPPRFLLLTCLAACSPDSNLKASSTSTATLPTTDASNSRPLALQVQPPDLTSNIELSALAIELEQRAEPPKVDLLEAMSGRVSLFDAQENRIDTTLKPTSDWSVQVAPERPLSEGWYVLAIDMDGVPFAPEPTLVAVDDAFISRFHVGSNPVLRQVVYCRGSVQVTFSELLLQPREGEPAEPIIVFADGSQCVIQPFEAGVEHLIYYQFTCAEGASEQLRVVRTGVLTTGERPAALLRADPTAPEVVLEFEDSYSFLGCTYWHMP